MFCGATFALPAIEPRHYITARQTREFLTFVALSDVLLPTFAVEKVSTEQMPIDGWHTCILSVVHGTFHLHTTFSQSSSLDFFIMLS